MVFWQLRLCVLSLMINTWCAEAERVIAAETSEDVRGARGGILKQVRVLPAHFHVSFGRWGMEVKLKVTIYTDGAARGNPEGPGGYGTILQFIDGNGRLHEKELSGGYIKTTNNRMELMAVLVGLEALRCPCEVQIVSDSKYVTDAFNKNWIDGWQKKNWRGASGPVKNVDLWKRLLEAAKTHQITFVWVKGHDGHPENERCDKLATTAADGSNLLSDPGV